MRMNHRVVARDEFKKLRPDWQCKKCAKALAAREEWEAKKVQQEGHIANYSSYKVDDLARRVNRELPHICPPSDFGEIAVSAHLGDRRDDFAVAVQFAPADEYDLSPNDFHEIKMMTMLQREFVKVFSEYGDDITKVEVSWGEGHGSALVAYIQDHRPGTQSESTEVRHPMRQLVEGLTESHHDDAWVADHEVIAHHNDGKGFQARHLKSHDYHDFYHDETKTHDGELPPVGAHVRAADYTHRVVKESEEHKGYSKSAVQKEIDKSNRRGGKGRIGGKEARMIHAILRGRQKSDEPTNESTDLEEGHGMFRANLYGTNTEKDNDGHKYNIRRFHHKGHTKTLARGVSLSFAKSHCNHPETSSASCSNRHAKRYTAKHGHWFDGYSEDK